MNNPKKRPGPGSRGNSPPDKRRASERASATDKYASSLSPVGSKNQLDPSHGAVVGNVPSGPAPKTKDGRRIDAYRPDRRRDSDQRQPQGAARTSDGNSLVKFNGGADALSANAIVSPISMHGEPNQCGSGGSTPIQQHAPVAPSMVPMVPTPSAQRSSAMKLSETAAGFVNTAVVGNNNRPIRQSGVPTGPHNIASIREIQARKMRKRDAELAGYPMKLSQSLGANNVGNPVPEATPPPQVHAKCIALQIEVNQLKSDRTKINDGIKRIKPIENDINNFREWCTKLEERLVQFPTMQKELNRLNEWRTSIQLQIPQVQDIKFELDGLKEAQTGLGMRIEQIPAIESDFKVLKDNHAGIETRLKQVEALRPSVDNLYTGHTDMLERQAALQVVVNELSQSNTALAEQIKELQNQVAAPRLSGLIQTEVKAVENTLRSMLNQGLKQEQERYSREFQSMLESRLEDHMSQVSKRISALSDSEAKTHERTNRSSSTLNELKDRLERLEEDMDGKMEAKLEKISKEVRLCNDDLNSEQTGVFGKLDTLSTRVAVLEGQVGDSTVLDQQQTPGSSSLLARVRNCETSCGQISIIQNRQGQIDDQQKHNVQRFNDTIKTLGDLDDRVKNFNSRLQTIEESSKETTREALDLKNVQQSNCRAIDDLKNRLQTLEQVRSDTEHQLRTTQEASRQVMDGFERRLKIAEQASEANSRKEVENFEHQLQHVEESMNATGRVTEDFNRRLQAVEQASQTRSNDRSPAGLAEINAINNNIQQLSDALEVTEKGLAACLSDVDVLKNHVPSFMTKSINDKLEPFRKNTEEAVQKINEIVESFSERISQLEQRPPQEPPTIEDPPPASFDEQLTGVKGRLEAVEHHKLDRQTANSMFQGVDERITNLTQANQVTRDQIDTDRRAINSLEDRYQSISTFGLHQQMVHWFQQTYPDAPALFQTIGKVQAGMNQLQALFHHSESRVDDTAAKVEQIRKAVDDFNKIYAAQSGLRQVRATLDRTSNEEWTEPATGNNKPEEGVEQIQTKLDDAKVRQMETALRAEMRGERQQCTQAHQKLEKRVTDVEGKVSKANEVLAMKDDIIKANQMLPYLMANDAKFMTIIKAFNANMDRPLEGLDFTMND